MIVMEKKFLSAEEVSEQLGISVGTVKKLLRDGVMPGYKIGNQWRINPQEFKKYLEQQSNQPKKTEEE